MRAWRFAFSILVVLVVSNFGCGRRDDQTPIAKSESPESSSFVATLNFTHRVYDEQGGDAKHESLEDTDVVEVKSRIKSFVASKLPRERIQLIRTSPEGFDIVVVDRNDDGTYEIGISTKLENEVFEANKERHDQPGVFADLFHAFVDRDPGVKTLVQWDHTEK
jgi:hypothetical protein